MLLGLIGGDHEATEVRNDANIVAPSAPPAFVLTNDVSMAFLDENGEELGQAVITADSTIDNNDLVDLLVDINDAFNATGDQVENIFAGNDGSGSIRLYNRYNFQLTNDGSVNVDLLGFTDVAGGTTAIADDATRGDSIYEVQAGNALSGEVVETGGTIQAMSRIEIRNVDSDDNSYSGGLWRSIDEVAGGGDVGIRIQGAAELSTHDDYSQRIGRRRSISTAIPRRVLATTSTSAPLPSAASWAPGSSISALQRRIPKF